MRIVLLCPGVPAPVLQSKEAPLPHRCPMVKCQAGLPALLQPFPFLRLAFPAKGGAVYASRGERICV